MIEENVEQSKQEHLEGNPVTIKENDLIKCKYTGMGNPVLHDLENTILKVDKVKDDYIVVVVNNKEGGGGPGAQVGDIKTIERKYIRDAYFEKI